MSCTDKICDKCGNYENCINMLENKGEKLLRYIEENPNATPEEFKELWNHLEEENRKENLTFKALTGC